MIVFTVIGILGRSGTLHIRLKHYLYNNSEFFNLVRFSEDICLKDQHTTSISNCKSYNIIWEKQSSDACLICQTTFSTFTVKMPRQFQNQRLINPSANTKLFEAYF